MIMYWLIFLVLSCNTLSYLLNDTNISDVNELAPCVATEDGIIGHISPSEYLLRLAFHSICNREPTMNERINYYNPLKNGEMNYEDLSITLINTVCKHETNPATSFKENYGQYINKSIASWGNRFEHQIYAWTVDFHPSPTACNIVIYKDIDVVLHPEIDHKPFCEYSGYCRKRLNTIFGLGGYMAGFALDPDHATLKRDFYEIYKNDSEFKRIDVFMCSHPVANCELFEKFNKSMVLFATTRLEFGRDDRNVPWRVREMSKWNSWGELKQRQRELIQFIHKYYLQNRLVLVANSVYDVKYIEYFTGFTPKYIPSWCGDLDNSYGLRSKWIGCVSNDRIYYSPTNNITLVVPYKQYLWAKYTDIDKNHELYKELQAAIENFTSVYNTHSQLGSSTFRRFPDIRHSNLEIRNHKPETYQKYSSLIFIPYQTSVMTFFELYRQNIPIFAPSLDLLVSWHQRFKILSGRIYGTPERHEDIISSILNVTDEVKAKYRIFESFRQESLENLEYNFRLNEFKRFNYSLIQGFNHQPINYMEIMKSIPNPNHDMNVESNYFWFQFSDIYCFDHIIYFHDWNHLVQLIATTDLMLVSHQMAITNAKSRIQISKSWDGVFKKLLPHKRKPIFR